MAYKDKDKQKEANRQASQRRRDKVKGVTPGMTNQGMTFGDSSMTVIPKSKTVWESEPGAAKAIDKISKGISVGVVALVPGQAEPKRREQADTRHY